MITHNVVAMLTPGEMEELLERRAMAAPVPPAAVCEGPTSTQGSAADCEPAPKASPLARLSKDQLIEIILARDPQVGTVLDKLQTDAENVRRQRDFARDEAITLAWKLDKIAAIVNPQPPSNACNDHNKLRASVEQAADGKPWEGSLGATQRYQCIHCGVDTRTERHNRLCSERVRPGIQ